MNPNFRQFAIVFICGMVGIVLAMIMFILNTRGILIDAYITATITIENVMTIIIVSWTALGVLIAALDS